MDDFGSPNLGPSKEADPESLDRRVKRPPIIGSQ